MAREQNLGSVAQIPPGEGRVFEFGKLRAAVFHTRDGQIFATQPECPHASGPLADGLLGNSAVVCPLHEYTYDLTSGTGKNTACKIAVYPVRLNANREILLTLDGG